jgi:hypothetical protein
MASRNLDPIAGDRSGFLFNARQQATNRHRRRPVSILTGYIRTSLLPTHSSNSSSYPHYVGSQLRRHPSGTLVETRRRRILSFSLPCMHASMLPATAWLKALTRDRGFYASAPGISSSCSCQACHHASSRIALENHARPARGVGDRVTVCSASPHGAMDLEHPSICAST